MGVIKKTEDLKEQEDLKIWNNLKKVIKFKNFKGVEMLEILKQLFFLWNFWKFKVQIQKKEKLMDDSLPITKIIYLTSSPFYKSVEINSEVIQIIIDEIKKEYVKEEINFVLIPLQEYFKRKYF